MTRHADVAVWPLLLATFLLLLCPPPTSADESLRASRTELSVGDRVTLEIPDAIGLAKPKWTLDPAGIVAFEDKDRTKAVVRALAPGRVMVSARVKLLDTTLYSVQLEVRPAGLTRGKPVVTGKDGGDNVKRPAMDDARMTQIGELLKRYETELGSIRTLFDQNADKNRTPVMGERTERRLGQITEKFFQELSGLGLSVRDLQQFKEAYKAAGPGGSPLFPGQGAWDDAFLGTERALMMGRAQLVQRLWLETLQDTFKANPDAAVFGEIDIGSWVKMRLGDLGFQADIDFSSVSIDPELNRWIVDRFEGKLRQHTSLDMVQADALLTPHGQATADVFIGDWGKTFAELDMLKRSKWKVIKVEKNPDGSLDLDENGRPKIRMVEKPGTQLFWEVAFRRLEAGRFAEVDFPKMDLAKEPMLSLEMLRHGIHDIEHGPYSRGQKLIKMLKYAERSYFMSKKAVAEYGFNPYAANDPLLAQAAEKVIANKNDPEKVADLLRALSGEEITADNVEAVTDKLVARAKTAMHDNAARALAFRLNAIARIDSDAARQQAAEKLWRDLGTELDTFRNTTGEPPKIMVEAQEMAKAVMEGKLPPAELEAKANALHKLLNEAYKLSDSVIDRILMSDSVLKLKAYLRRLGWVEKAIDDFATKAKQKFPNVADFHGKVMELNAQLEKTTSGSGLLKAADWADNAFTVYEAYFNSDASDALLNASIAMGRVGVQSYLPSMQIPFAVYDSLKSGSPKPLGMAVAFMYFPFAGQTYMVSGLMQRADVGIRDAEFYNALNKVLEVTQFDTQGRITGFSLRNILGKEIDSESISPPGNRKAIVALFTRPESSFYVSPNFRYWSSLVPKEDDRFGRYENKLQNLRRFFGLSEDVRYMTVMLENFKAKSDAMPRDQYTPQRQAALQHMEAQLTETLWVAMADMLESAAKSVNVAELEAKAKKLEEDLNLRDYDLGKNKGLLSRIKWEIRQNSSLLSGENPYTVTLIYDKYLKAYERVDALRKQVVLEVWQGGFGIDYVAAQGKPMKLLLMGGKAGAPALSGDPAQDVDLAEKTLAAHRARAEAIRADLANALGRALDDTLDRDHLKALGQIGLEWEHLLDDCAGRAAPNCESTVRTALQDRVKRYKDYLAKLISASQVVTLEILGPTDMKLGDSAEFEARFAKPEDQSRPGLALNWSVNNRAMGSGARVKIKADQAGAMNLVLSATSKASGTEKKLGEATRTVTVRGGKDEKPAANAKLAADIDSALKAKDWKRLVDLLAQVKKDEQRRLKDSTAWQADVDALTRALDSLKKERLQWALAWQDYMDALDHIDSLTWDKLTRAVDRQRELTQERCYKDSSPSEDPRKREARCQKEASNFYDTCLSDWPKQHFEERQRIRMAKEQLPDKVQSLHSAGYFSHKDWFEAVEKLADQYKLPYPWPNPVTPRLKYAASCASVDLPTGAKKPEAADFKVTVNVPQAIVPYGQSVTLTASAQGGKAPHSYAWSTGGSGARVTVTPRWAGEWTVTVTATDANGKTGEGQGTLMVSPAKVKMNGTQPQVFYGSRAPLSLPGKEAPPPAPDPCAGRKATNPYDECLRIDVKALKSVSTANPNYMPPAPGMVHDPAQVQALPESAPPPRTGKQKVVWQSEPAVGFNPPTSEDGRTQVIYSRMGPVKLWCEILEAIDGDFRTVGECEQETVQVIAPRFSVSFTPPEGQGRVGQDIRALVTSQPAVNDDLIDFRWFDPPGANRMELTSNAREISFKVKDARPLVLKALARVPYHGDEIAEVSGSYTATAYEVKIGPPRARGPQLQVWVCDTQLGNAQKCGMKNLPQGQFATFQDIFLQAQVTPAPTSPRYLWSVDPSGSCGLPGSGSELRLNCSSTGSYTVRLQVHDADNTLLGQDEIGISVSASDNDIRQAPKSKEAYDKMQQAKQQANMGQLDPAIELANAAAGLDPKNAEAKDLGKRWSDERNTVHQLIDQARKALQGNKPEDAQKAIDAAKKLHPRYPPVIDAEKQLAEKRKALGQSTTSPVIGNAQPISLAGVGGNQTTPRTVKGVTIDDSSWIRFKSTDENRKRLDIPVPTPTRAAAVAIVSNLDDATYLEEGKTIARIIVSKDTGDEVLEIQAAVHTSEWNYGVGPKHKRVDSADIGDNRFLVVLPLARPGTVQGLRIEYVETNAPMWAGHAPGFCLRGISLVSDTRGLTLTPAGTPTNAVATGTVNVTGKWRTSEGELTLVQSGRSVTGSYTSDGGEIVGEMNGNVLEGFWIENGSAERCATAKNGRHYWGRIRWTFEGGRFTGNWSYCDKPVAGGGGWNGERSGDVPPGYAPPSSASSTAAAGSGSAENKPPGVASSVGTPAGTPRIAEFTWLGMDEDRVGDWGNGKANGTRDGHFRLTLEAPGRFGLATLSLWSANERGEKAGGQIWHTRNGNYWMLGVFRDGRQLNASHVASLGDFPERVSLDLYANSSGWFNPGQWFLLELETTDGKVLRHLIRLGEAGIRQGGTFSSPGGRDYTGHESSSATPDPHSGTGYLRIEACVDGSDWISLDHGRLNHQHRAFAQIGTHGGCPASHQVAGGGFLVDGLPVNLARLPMPVGMAGIGRFEVERGRGQVRLDGANRILIDDDAAGGPDVYIIRLYPSAAAAATTPVSTLPGGRDYTAAPVQGQLIFEVGNIGAVGNGPSKATRFTLTAPHVITLIRNYHWNGARGAAPGTIALKARDGAGYGPWQASGSPGQGGVPNAYWSVYPNVTLPAGTYTVIDSDPATWSHNAESGNRGFVRVEGYPADASPSTSPATGNTQVDSLMKEVDGLLDAVKSLKGLFGK